MSTIAIIACCDTKAAEIAFTKQRLESGGHDVLVIDVSTSADFTSPGDITREQVCASTGNPWLGLAGQPKDVLLAAMAEGAAVTLRSLEAAGRIDGVIGMGGLQNTTIAATGMQALPLGFPKLIVSTVACGTRTFDLIVGTRDILVLPSITDLAGLNTISEAVLANAAAAISGMVKNGVRGVAKSDKLIVGTTLMGATNDAVVEAANRLESHGQPVMCFHSTGVGGQILEELITDGVIRGAMDLTLHEIVYEYFGGGFGAGTKNRLLAGAKAGIPMLVVPGGIDFICQWKDALFDDIDQRRWIWHNPALAHVKLRVNEARDIAGLIVERLNQATGHVVVLFPTLGLRTFAKAGEPLHDAEVDRAILEVLRSGLKPEIEFTTVEASIMDPEFSQMAADRMLELMSEVQQ